jgi:hypothetical protein
VEAAFEMSHNRMKKEMSKARVCPRNLGLDSNSAVPHAYNDVDDHRYSLHSIGTKTLLLISFLKRSNNKRYNYPLSTVSAVLAIITSGYEASRPTQVLTSSL